MGPGGGRPPGSRNLSTILKEYLELEVETEDPVTGKKVTAQVKEIINAKLIRKAMLGNDRSITEIFDRLEGKPKQKLDVTGDMKVKGFLQSCTKKALAK